MIKLIVAVDKNFAIGKDNKMPWKIKGEMDHFVKHTVGNVVVMGRKTWESIGSKPLENRINYIVTKNKKPMELPVNTYVINSLSEINEIDHKLNGTADVYIIGGGTIYQEVLDRGLATEIILSEVDLEIESPDASIEIPDFYEVTHEFGTFIDTNKKTGEPVEYTIKKLCRLY